MSNDNRNSDPNSLEAQLQAELQGQLQGQGQGEGQGQGQLSLQGQGEGQGQGQDQASLQGQGQAQGQNDYQGQSQSSLDANGNLNGNGNGNLNGNGNANLDANGNANGNANLDANGNANGNANLNANGNSNLSDNINHDVNSNLNANANLNATSTSVDVKLDLSGTADLGHNGGLINMDNLDLHNLSGSFFANTDSVTQNGTQNFNLDQINNLVANNTLGSASVGFSADTGSSSSDGYGWGHDGSSASAQPVFSMSADAHGGTAYGSSITGGIDAGPTSPLSNIGTASADTAITQSAFTQNIVMGANIQFNSLTLSNVGHDSITTNGDPGMSGGHH